MTVRGLFQLEAVKVSVLPALTPDRARSVAECPPIVTVTVTVGTWDSSTV